jgi:hypothetical protein
VLFAGRIMAGNSSDDGTLDPAYGTQQIHVQYDG